MNTLSDYIVKASSILTENGWMPDFALRIKDCRIVDINQAAAFHGSSHIVDFTGYSIAPCFCDYHLHLFSRKRINHDAAIDELVKHGITTAYDGGSQDKFSLALKESARDILHIRSAGAAIYKRDGYGKYLGYGVDSAKEAEQVIDGLVASGADYIKIINSGIYDPDKNNITAGGFTAGELSVIVNYARERGIETACHANGEQAIEDAVNAQVSYVIHGLGASERSLSFMHDRRIAFVPTIHAFASLKKIYSSEKHHRNIDHTVQSHINTARMAFDMGLRVLPGSDSGPEFIPYGVSYYDELEKFKSAGMPENHIVLSAVDEHFKIGSRADFLVLEGIHPRKVFVKGTCVKDTEHVKGD